ncbi:hypothetical protein D5R81_14690 [Parashewanella spongiae]|uniref:Uncharacterized protein n=1 Tax=Parashewanella spongiae TaxID=342950 RepID=A0A3A6TQI9_9GAMM|nr:hypothetical protein [Parashewanella spongiae]MCL1077073.1 hypothetical protein [Parashewanella spongiae]RJY10456.1 hypothetical protein D5R81_14690 [Parashewanella spongiae]
MKLVEKFVALLLWLGISASPTLIGILLGGVVGLSNGLLEMSILVCGGVGFFIGGLWAEKVRRSTGLAHFWGRLIGARDPI